MKKHKEPEVSLPFEHEHKLTPDEVRVKNSLQSLLKESEHMD